MSLRAMIEAKRFMKFIEIKYSESVAKLPKSDEIFWKSWLALEYKDWRTLDETSTEFFPRPHSS